jgi:exosortase
MASTNAPKPNWRLKLQRFLKTEAGVIAAIVGLMACAFYLSWGWLNLSKSPISLGLVGTGIYYLWQARANLAQQNRIVEERVLGYGLAGVGISLFVGFYGSASFQWLAFVITLLGFALGLWGSGFLLKYIGPISLIILGLYPDIIFLTRRVWDFVTPPFMLENFMTSLAGKTFQLFGQPADFQARYITIGNGSVEVGAGCSGFDMMISISAVAIIFGLIYKQHWKKIFFAVSIGIVMAILINVPRVMLLAHVVGYYSDAVFDFWHGPWGGQIFMAILFTPYYYLMMAIYNCQSTPRVSGSG